MKKNVSVAALVSVLVLALGVVIVMIMKYEMKMETARSQATQWVLKLDATRTENGHYQRFPDQYLPETDPWGNHLMVTYTQGTFREAVSVRSAGGDGAYFTSDDIAVERFRLDAKSAGKAAGDFLEGAAKGKTKGIIEGLKEGIKGKPPEDKK